MLLQRGYSCAACSWVTHYLFRWTFSHASPLILSDLWYDLRFQLLLVLLRLLLFVYYEDVGLLATESHHNNSYLWCWLVISLNTLCLLEEKGNSCELRDYFVNYITIVSSSTVNAGTIAYEFIYEIPKNTLSAYMHAKHFKRSQFRQNTNLKRVNPWKISPQRWLYNT